MVSAVTVNSLCRQGGWFALAAVIITNCTNEDVQFSVKDRERLALPERSRPTQSCEKEYHSLLLDQSVLWLQTNSSSSHLMADSTLCCSSTTVSNYTQPLSAALLIPDSSSSASGLRLIMSNLRSTSVKCVIREELCSKHLINECLSHQEGIAMFMLRVTGMTGLSWSVTGK